MTIVRRKKKKKVVEVPSIIQIEKKNIEAPSPRVIKRAFRTGGVVLLRESERRKKLALLISENVVKPRPLSMYEMMIQAGYSHSTARARAKETGDAARQEPIVQDHLERLRKIREKMLVRLEATVGEATFGAIGFNLSVVEKSIALMEGRPTERREIILDPEEQALLDEILGDNE